jgi:hypothetical protein
MVALVRFFRRTEACILAHGPQFIAVHGRVHATGKGKFPGFFRHLYRLTIHLLYFNIRIGNYLFIAH